MLQDKNIYITAHFIQGLIFFDTDILRHIGEA